MRYVKHRADTTRRSTSTSLLALGMLWSIHHSTVVALAEPWASLGHELCHVVGFSEGQGPSDQKDLMENFYKAANTVIDVV